MFKNASRKSVSLPLSLIFLLVSSTAFPQARVVDAAGSTVNNSNSTSPASNQTNAAQNNASSNGNDFMVTLYNMVESLQSEVQTLRGLVEEQGFQIRQMQNTQRDRYLDVDDRLSELNQKVSQAAGASPSSFLGSDILQQSSLESSVQAALNSNVGDAVTIDMDVSMTTGQNPGEIEAALTNTDIAGVVNIDDSPTQSGTDTSLVLANENPVALIKTEEELYQDARNLLLNDAEYEASISVFQQMIEQYPQGRLAPNAYYWQGEALILVNRYSQAINVFNQVIDNFPTHEKAPDSMLKLGIVYSIMNNTRRADQVWTELLTNYADSGSASLRLAEMYLRDGYNR